MRYVSVVCLLVNVEFKYIYESETMLSFSSTSFTHTNIIHTRHHISEQRTRHNCYSNFAFFVIQTEERAIIWC